MEERWWLDARYGDHASRLAECLICHVLNQAHARVPIMVPDIICFPAFSFRLHQLIRIMREYSEMTTTHDAIRSSCYRFGYDSLETVQCFVLPLLCSDL